MEPKNSTCKSRIAFLTLPSYSMIALSNAIEPLRMTNAVSRQRLYNWQVVSLDGRPVDASNGLSISPTVALDELTDTDILFVCGGTKIHSAVTPELISALRRLSRQHMALGALCTGGYALAKAGLLDNYRATIHWENLSSLREEFPRVILSNQIFSIDRDRYTCSGGIAPLDMMLHLIKQQLGDVGTEAASLVSQQFILDRVRSDQDRQYVPLKAEVGMCHKSLIKAAALMESHIEEPLSLDDLATLTGVSRRQIERMFKRHLNRVPTRYYLELRLRRARELLLQTSMPIMDITIACGFQSPPHFSKCYRSLFGHPPSAERKITQGAREERSSILKTVALA